MTLEYAVRKAACDALSAALAVLTPTVPVLDHPAQDQPMPYVTLDRVLGRNDDIVADDLVTLLLYFSVWSRARGHRQVQDIVGAARAALNRADLGLSEGHAILCRVTRTDVVRDGDGVTYLGSIEVEILANP